MIDYFCLNTNKVLNNLKNNRLSIHQRHHDKQQAYNLQISLSSQSHFAIRSRLFTSSQSFLNGRKNNQQSQTTCLRWWLVSTFASLLDYWHLIYFALSKNGRDLLLWFDFFDVTFSSSNIPKICLTYTFFPFGLFLLVSCAPLVCPNAFQLHLSSVHLFYPK